MTKPASVSLLTTRCQQGVPTTQRTGRGSKPPIDHEIQQTRMGGPPKKMNNDIVPLFCTQQIDATKAFYQEHLGFGVAVEMPGYVELERGKGGPRLGFMTPEDGKWQAAAGQGLIYCFQVENADAEHARLAREGVTIVDEPEDKPWGERGFLAADPNGITLYFGHVLESTSSTR